MSDTKGKRTRGPWDVWDLLALEDEIRIMDDGGSCVAILPLCGRDYDDCRADASLVSAAHDLLALVQAVEWVDGQCPWCYAIERYGHKADCPRQADLRKAGVIE